MLLCLVMCLVLMPAAMAAMETETEYDVWANGRQFTNAQRTISCGSGTATYDPATRTLTLDGAEIEDAYYELNEDGELISSGIRAKGALTVDVTGDSSIDMGNAMAGGIYADGDLILTGSNDLEIHLKSESCYGL